MKKLLPFFLLCVAARSFAFDFANLTITKTSDQAVYGVNQPAVFTITISNLDAFPVSIDKITDELPPGFVFQSFHASSQVNAANSSTAPAYGATGNILFEGSLTSTGDHSYNVPANGSLVVRYTAKASPSPATNLVTTAQWYIGATESGSAQNTVSVTGTLTLPNTLFSFSADWINSSWIKLKWMIINETTSDRFEIERSTDNSPFAPIGKVTSIGTPGIPQLYSFIDSFPARINNKYRLKMMGTSNTAKYSPVVLVTRRQDGWELAKVFPTPFTHELNLQLVCDKRINLLVELTDARGKLVVNRNLSCPTGTNTILLDQLQTLPPGMYNLRLSAEGKILKQKLLK